MMWRGHKIRLGFHNSPECQAGDGQRSQVSTAWVDTWDLWSAEQGCDSPGLWHRSQPAPVSEREGPFGAGGEEIGRPEHKNSMVGGDNRHC